MDTPYDAERNPVRSATATLPGRTLHYFECGAGLPVVFLHGYTDSWQTFRLVLPDLAGHVRCLALDQRGHGRSRFDGDDFSMAAFAGDVVDFIRALGLGRVALVGHSMGSLVARRVALLRPDLVDRLVLVGAPLRVDTPAIRDMLVELAGFGDAVPRQYARDFQAACVADRSSVPAWFFDVCVEASAGVPGRVWRAALAGILADDSADRAPEIQKSTLSIGGREDAFFGPDEQLALTRAMPRARLVLYDRVGHCPNWERPQRFAADVAAFLTGRV